MGTYLDVRLAHVQRYIHRSRSLAYQRGASSLVVEALQGPVDDAISTWNEAGNGGSVDRCDRETTVSGKASIQLPDDVADDVLERFTLSLFEKVHAAVPGAHLEAVRGTGTTLLEARFGDMVERSGRGEGFSAPAARLDVPFVGRCSECGAFPADGGPHRFPDDVPREYDARGVEVATGAVCRDCAARERAAGFRQPVTRAKRPDVERRLADQIGEAHPATTDSQPPPDFSSLAKLSPTRDLRRNHLATVSADVNTLGQLCAAVGASEHPEKLPEIARGVSNALWAGLVSGTLAVQGRLDTDADLEEAEGGKVGRLRRLGVVPHWCGGDDLLVTLPAGYAWTFVTGLLRGFVNALEGLELPAEVVSKSPSLSVGLVFAHAKLPRGTCVDAAEAALGHAKQVSAQRRFEAPEGDRADAQRWCTVTWTDLTQASTFRATDIDTFSLPELEAPDLLEVVAELPQDTRRVLAAALVDDPATDPGPVLRRLGHDAAAAALEDDDVDGVELRRALLAVHRWWRA